jgi:hypothetical protein
MHDAATIDPTVAFGEGTSPDLMRLAAAQLSVSAPPSTAKAPAWISTRGAASSSSLTA